MRNKKERAVFLLSVLSAAIIAVFAAHGAVSAQEMHHNMHNHTMMHDHDNQGMEGMHEGGQAHMAGNETMGSMGEAIRETSISGYALSYRLIDMKKRAENMGMPMAGQMAMTHHLMVSIKGPDGKPVTGAKVGFLVAGPDGKTSTAMCMAMGDGYGADINLSSPGSYTIKAKAVAGDLKLIDEFVYELK